MAEVDGWTFRAFRRYAPVCCGSVGVILPQNAWVSACGQLRTVGVSQN